MQKAIMIRLPMGNVTATTVGRLIMARNMVSVMTSRAAMKSRAIGKSLRQAKKPTTGKVMLIQREVATKI